MSVYVGKDVDIVIQIPCEEDVSSQANGANVTFVVSNTPISDRDMDGVPNEVAHVTVYVNGEQATVTNVNDSTGQVTLQSAPLANDRVIIEYRYDSSPEIAQEISIEPRQAIEGIDGLGSNKVQEWAVLLKEFSGSLKEVFRKTEQFKRLSKKKLGSQYTNQFYFASALDDFEGDTGNFEISSNELLVNTDNSSLIGVKPSVLPIFRDGIIKCQVKGAGSGRVGWMCRWDGLISGKDCYMIYFYAQKLTIDRVVDGAVTEIFQSGDLTVPSDQFFPVVIRFFGAKIEVDVNDGAYEFSVVDSAPLLAKGRPGMYAYLANTKRYDDFQIWSEVSPNEYGLILNYTREGSAVKLGIDGVVFPAGSIPSPKNAPVLITSSFRARKIKFIT